jgi:hypothetical protein
MKNFFFGKNSQDKNKGGKITVNGTTYEGNSIQIKGDVISINGHRVDISNEKSIEIFVKGDINSMQVDRCSSIEVINVGELKTASGDVEVRGSVTGSVSTTSGDIEVDGDIEGNATSTSGDITASRIGGNVSTVSGDISK